MNNSPLFSVLIANYNNGKYLYEAIKSVYMQTYSNWEIIIVDDCSNDNSINIYRKLNNNKQIKIYFNEYNQGCGYTKRRCAEFAIGELCGFLDPDDTLTQDALEVMVNLHLNNKDASLITSRYNFCDEKLNFLWVSEVREKNEKISYLVDRDHTAEQFTVFKMDAYKNTSGINPNIKRAVDMDLYFKLEEVGKMLFVDNILYNYRLHPGGISQTDYKAKYWHILAAKDACERRGIDIEEVANKILMKDKVFYENKIKFLLNSAYYRLGYIILNPVSKVYKKIRTVFKK